MSSMSGYVTYVEYTTGTKKGTTNKGELLNSPFKLGDAHVDYTSARVVEEFTLVASNISTTTASNDTATVSAAWFPVYNGSAEDAKVRIVSLTTVGSAALTDIDSISVVNDGKDIKVVLKNSKAFAADDKIKAAYVYDNVVIPQNDLPIINAKMKSIALVAKARRIAVYYSQMAAFQAKTDYGLNLGDQLAQKAMSELQYK